MRLPWRFWRRPKMKIRRMTARMPRFQPELVERTTPERYDDVVKAIQAEQKRSAR